MLRGARIETLILRFSDVAKVIDMKKVVEVVEMAFKEKAMGKVQMPPKHYIYFKEHGGDLRVMPAYIETLGVAGVKVVNSHPANPSKYTLPTVMATLILIEPATGRPLCIMDGTLITRYRTGAAAAVATKHLYGRHSGIVALIGAGAMAPYVIEALRHTITIEMVKVYDIVKSKAESLASWCREKLGLEALAATSAEEAVRGSDVLVTLTPSRKPVVNDEWVAPGTHINAMGADAPGKQELDPKILKRARIIVDDMEQALHSGEVNVPISQGVLRPDEICCELGEVASGLKRGRLSPSDITVFVSTGLAIQDVATAWLVYTEALKLGLGTTVRIVDEEL